MVHTANGVIMCVVKAFNFGEFHIISILRFLYTRQVNRQVRGSLPYRERKVNTKLKKKKYI